MATRKEVYSSSSLSKSKQKRGHSSFKRQNKNMETPTIVALIMAQQRAPVSRSQESVGFCRLCFPNSHQASECFVVHLQVRLKLLPRREKKNGNLPSKRKWSPPRGRPQSYGGPIIPSHRSSIKPTVTLGVGNTGTVYQTGSSSNRPIQKN